METAIQNENAQQQQTPQKKEFNWNGFFFWFGYIILLLASIPHAAYILAAYTDLSDFEWVISFAGAGLIELSIYVSTFAIYKIFKRGFKWNWGDVLAVFGLLLWNIACTGISWLLNSQHAAHFHHPDMLTGTEGIPLQNFTPYLASIWPVLGIIFSVVSPIVTQRVKEIGEVTVDRRSPEQIKKEAEITIATMRAQAAISLAESTINAQKRETALSSGVGSVISGMKKGVQNGLSKQGQQNDHIDALLNSIGTEVTIEEVEEIHETQEQSQQADHPVLELPQHELTQEEKQDRAVEAVEKNPNITDAEMQKLLGLENENKAHFWVVKAQSILESRKEVYNTYTPEQKLEIAVNALKANPHMTKEDMATALGTKNAFAGMTWLRRAQEQFVPLEEQRELIGQRVEETISGQEAIETEIYHIEDDPVPVSNNGNGHASQAVQFATTQIAEKKPEPKKTYYQLINGDHVGYNNAKPYFELEGVTFASITGAYQKAHKKNVYRSDLAHEKITYLALAQLVKEKKIAQEYVRLVTTKKPFAKTDERNAVAVTIAIHESAYEHILNLLEA